MQSPFEWQRGPRSSHRLASDSGVYALFLRERSIMPGINVGKEGLLYIGLAAGKTGFRGRCHFDARTRNHSPRKSLAVLLMSELALAPVLIPKPNASDTWGLDAQSDAKLSAWMHDNLDVAFEISANPIVRESELIGRHAPPLNLAKCLQTQQHRQILLARAEVMASLQSSG